MNKYSLMAPEIKEIWDDPDFEKKILDAFSDLHAYEISSSIEGLEPQEISRILLALNSPQNIEVFEAFEDEDKRDILLCFDKQKRAQFIEDMSPDERVDLMHILSEDVKDDIYRLIAQAERNDIKKLLQYEEGSAGSIMTTEYASLPADISVKVALNKLRSIAPDKETIYYVYIVDEKNNLIGFISLKKLILAKVDSLIKDIMNTEVISVNVFDDQEEVSKIISDYDLLAVPVIDNEGKFIGIVTVDDIVDVVIEEDTEDILHYGAVEKHINYLKSNPFYIARQRIIWLFILVAMGFLSGYVLERYKDVLDAVVALVFFIPLLCASGGNAGTQASTVIIRGLATDEISMTDWLQVFYKEISIGILMGLGMGLVSCIRACFIKGADIRLGLVVGSSMVFIVVLANALGALLPVVLKKMKLDPALVSGPFIASMVDICCIFSYFEIARYIYNL
jgi:magnesium transporter